jgi:hypothetical protein
VSIEVAQADLLWQETLKHLRPGDVPTIHWALGWAAVSLDPVARTLSTRVGAWGTGDYRKRTVPRVTREALPGAPGALAKGACRECRMAFEAAPVCESCPEDETNALADCAVLGRDRRCPGE